MIPAVEAAAHRKMTEAFIKADAENVVLTPRVRTRTPSNGYTYADDSPRPSQVMRLIPQSVSSSVERETLEGRIVRPTFVLLGVWGAGMERGDVFTLEGNRYEVVYVHEKRDYQVKGEVVYVGR